MGAGVAGRGQVGPFPAVHPGVHIVQDLRQYFGADLPQRRQQTSETQDELPQVSWQACDLGGVGLIEGDHGERDTANSQPAVDLLEGHAPNASLGARNMRPVERSSLDEVVLREAGTLTGGP